MSVSVCLSVCLSVMEVHWRIIANLCFKFRLNLPRIAVAVHAGASTEVFIVQWARGKGSSPGRVEHLFYFILFYFTCERGIMHRIKSAYKRRSSKPSILRHAQH